MTLLKNRDNRGKMQIFKKEDWYLGYVRSSHTPQWNVHCGLFITACFAGNSSTKEEKMLEMSLLWKAEGWWLEKKRLLRRLLEGEQRK